MNVLRYYCSGKLYSFQAATPQVLLNAKPKAMAARAGPGARSMRSSLASLGTMAVSQGERFTNLFHGFNKGEALVSMPKGSPQMVIPTETLVVEGASKAEIKRLRDERGLTVLREGTQGKLLLKAPEGGEIGVRQVFEAARATFERGYVRSAHPNFVRAMPHIKPAAAGGSPLWNHTNDGNPGVPGADVAALAAWTITRGKPAIRVAVLDEGVDTSHPALKPAVVAEQDFVDHNPNARPDGDDAHGTACAGIIVSRDAATPGLAPQCSLVAIRIAKGDGNEGWVFDDFQTADAIDWAWDVGRADVLSNSWGGGPPVDVITNAFERARVKGRGGKGCVVVIASGNENGAISFPGTLTNVLCVGASSPWDERKSPTSKDGENWWGSNFGPNLDLVAPGVKIATTDIRGGAGYSTKNFVTTFNGTSSATPHAAAGAALILSAVPALSERKVREVVQASADRLSYNKNGAWHKEVGWGRLNLFAGLRLARR